MPMKRLVVLLFVASFINVNAENINDNDDCTAHGYPLNDIIKVEKTIQKALKTNDMSLLAEQFNYPFAVNLAYGRRIITNKQELINNFSSIYSKADIEEIVTEKNSVPFCRYDGAAIFGGMWLSINNKDKKIKVAVINSETTKLSSDAPYGIPVMPIDDLESLKEFANRYNRSDESKKIVDVKSLKVDINKNDKYKRYLVSGMLLKPGYQSFSLYRVDINNDGQPEWVLVSQCEGSMCSSGIEGVYKSKDRVLEDISFDNVIVSNFNLGDMSKWYLFTDNPLFTLLKEKTLLNFYNGVPPQVCSYLWQNNKVTLVHGNQNYCIH